MDSRHVIKGDWPVTANITTAQDLVRRSIYTLSDVDDCVFSDDIAPISIKSHTTSFTFGLRVEPKEVE